MKTKLVFSVLLTLSLFISGYAQTLDKTKLDQFFDRLAEKNKAMGSLTITKDGNPIYKRAIGFSHINGAEKKPATPATRYRIGSISKMFTAVMIFQLIDEGKLKLTDTLDKFYPQIPNAGKITIAQILAHRSGIHSFTDDPDFRTWRMNTKTKDEILDVIAKSTPDFEPDAKYNYSNAGYIVLSYVVEKITGKNYQDALKERITSKVGLADTYLGTGNNDVTKNESLSYRYTEDWTVQPETHLSIPIGAGAIISTSHDLNKFIESLFNLKLVSQDSLNQMMQKNMGMETFPLDGKTFYGHGGAIDGFRSLLFYLPEEKLAIAYTANGVAYQQNSIVAGVFEIYQNKPFTIPAFETVAVSPEILDKYVGVYSKEGVPVKVTITRNGGTLSFQLTGQSAFQLDATAPNKFRFDQTGVILEFDASKNQMLVKQGTRETIFTKEGQ